MNFLVLRHVDCEGLGLWEACCQQAGIAIDLVDLHRGGNLPPPHRFQAVISLGGPMNVYEEEAYPFLKREDAYIRQVLALGVPNLGVCPGGQLLAKAVGGVVTRNGMGEIGWDAVELDLPGQRDPLFAGLPESLPVFQWHGDTFSIPKGAVRLAASPACENQAFRCGFGGIAYALQFHLEVTPAMLEQWVRALGRGLDVGRTAADVGLGETRGDDFLSPNCRDEVLPFLCLRSHQEDGGSAHQRVEQGIYGNGRRDLADLLDEDAKGRQLKAVLPSLNGDFFLATLHSQSGGAKAACPA